MPVNRRPNTVCDRCREPIYRRPFNLQRQVGKFCSRACRNRAYPRKGFGLTTPLRGAENPAWKGGVTYRHRRGNYVQVKYVRAPEWAKPMARKDGYLMEHRLVMAQMVGRLLARTEVVHHRDHAPLNNVRDNLELWPTNRDHKLAEYGRYVSGVANRLSLAA